MVSAQPEVKWRLGGYARKRNVIYIRQIRVKHLELTLGYMGSLFNNGSMTISYPERAI